MTISITAHIGILLGRFPGRYTRPKTGIFSRSQYELSHLQNFVLRHIGGIATRLSRDCPISRRPLTFTHGEISQKFFPKNFGLFRKSPRTLPQNSQNPPKLRKTPFMSKKPRNVTSRRNFSKKFFPKFFPRFLRPSGACVKMRKMLDREKFFAKFFSKNFWNF